MLTGRLVEVDEDARRDLPGFLKRLASRVGEPVVRAAVGQAVRIMGEQFVLGRTIEAALKRAAAEALHLPRSICWAKERARKATPSAYEAAYADAIEAVGQRCVLPDRRRDTGSR